jgi:hypothetical protein
MKMRISIGFLLTLLAAAGQGENVARYVEDIGRSGLLSAPVGEPPEVTSVAGERFLNLVPDSQREVCRILLLHKANELKGLNRLKVVDARGNEVMRCSL